MTPPVSSRPDHRDERSQMPLTAAELAALNHAPVYQAAVTYANAGWAVLPVAGIVNGHCSCRAAAMCDQPGKHPLGRHGLREATTDLEQIRRWWQKWPAASVAVRTGTISGLVVVDIDPAHGGAETMAKLHHDAVLRPGNLATPTVRTGGGGMHLFYRHPGGNIPNTAGRLPKLGALPGVDLRGDGGYIILAPSLHRSGRRYQWDDAASGELAELPHWARPTPPQPRPSPRPGQSMTDAAISRYARAAVEGEAAAVRSAVEGTRNATLNRAAFKLGTLVGAGAVDETTVEAVLLEAGTAAGLGGIEAARTVRSGLAAGIARPREIRPATPTRQIPQAARTAEGLAPPVARPAEPGIQPSIM
jgi:hypothetical protein